MKASQDFFEGDYVKRIGNLGYPTHEDEFFSGEVILEGIVGERCKKGDEIKFWI